MTGSVACVGSLNLDRRLEVARLPGPGETVLARTASESGGGKGANQAAAAAAFGATVTMVGCVGEDPAGTRLVDDLVGRGVRCAVRRVSEAPSGSATVVVDAERGENMIVVAPGANGCVGVGDVEIGAVREAAVLVAQLEVPLEAVVAAARACGGCFMLNCAPWQPLGRELLDRIDVLVANQSEIGELAGGSAPGSLEDVETVLGGLGLGCSVVVTAGAAGAVVSEAGVVTHLAAPRVDPVDTTGAGDCFCGVLAAGLAEGGGLTEGAGLVDAAQDAVVAAALSTLAAGARGRLPGRDEVRAHAA